MSNIDTDLIRRSGQKKFQMSFDSEIINDFSLQRIRHLNGTTKKQLKRSNLGKINLITILWTQLDPLNVCPQSKNNQKRINVKILERVDNFVFTQKG